MYKLLIVDDEQMIVDWLYRLFGGLPQLELDLYKAYTGEQALGWLNRTKIDIVLTDIHMPEMNGIQLLENIKSRWPDCKVIFLTGYNEFDYVYAAIKHEGVNYLLKTEEDSVIIGAVEKAVGEIEQSFRNTELIDRARQQVGRALPLIQREYLASLLRGEASPLPDKQEQLDEMELPLKADLPVFMLLGRMDPVSRKLAQIERTRLVYTIKNIVEAYLGDNRYLAYIADEAAYSLWLIQPVDPAADWERSWLFLKETLETVQRTCAESLQAGMSFALASSPTGWDQVSGKHYALKQLLDRRIGEECGIVLTDDESSLRESEGRTVQDQARYSLRDLLNKIGKLENCLERGQSRDFFDLFAEIASFLQDVPDMGDSAALEVYLSLSLKLLSYINRRESAAKPLLREGIDKLLDARAFDSWAEAAQFLRELSRKLFDAQETEQENSERDIVMQIQQYIVKHLADDISLVRLGELTHFNPSYLSRLFKQITGTNISDHIQQARVNKAKELLGSSAMRIHEIAAVIGLDSPAYFAKFFKKALHMTPQEYRDTQTKL